MPPVDRDDTLANALGDGSQVGGKILQGISAGARGFHVMTPAICQVNRCSGGFPASLRMPDWQAETVASQ
ncbi:hypothetical protein GCM10027081_11640 [Cupriavidus yeoncheonensis]